MGAPTLSESEKRGVALPQPAQASPRPKPARRGRWMLFVRIFAVLLSVAYLFRNTLSGHVYSWSRIRAYLEDSLDLYSDVTCPAQPPALTPPLSIQWDDELREKSTKLYQAAVQIPTVSYDDNGLPTEDPRWAPFFDFQRWLEGAFPTAWKAANVEFINTLGILATFEGSDPSLKPLLLMSHYDVTPVPEATLDRWTHPPFSGYNDGEWIWGRGSSDDKTLLVGQWEAMTYLLEAGFKPRRTVILSHGFDEEEVFARQGQGRIAPFLEERYGKDGLFMVIDEGGGSDDDFYGTAFALPAMGEKGYVDIVISVGTDGGHSSVPPPHTGIGIMSKLISALEDHPYKPALTPKSPVLSALHCAADYSSSFPAKYRKLLSHGRAGWAKIAHSMASESDYDRAMLGTTQAIDVIRGGVKVNALPELVVAQVNHRIDFDESIAAVQAHMEKVVGKVAKKLGLTLVPFAETAKLAASASLDSESKFPNATMVAKTVSTAVEAAAGLKPPYVALSLFGPGLEPAPRTPASGNAWEVFAGSVKATLPPPAHLADLGQKERFVAPFASTGNTDCKMYYNLSKNVYRFSAIAAGQAANIHTVDERATVKSHFGLVDFFHAVVQNADAVQGN